MKMMTIDEITRAAGEDARFRVEGWGGVAFYFRALDTEPTPDTHWDGIEEPTGMVRLVMVGDDRVHIIDPADVSAIPEDAYCHVCGQIGCTADGRTG